MGSNGEEASNDKVTLEIMPLEDRRKTSVRTDLDLTIEEFKLVVASVLNIPSDRPFVLVSKGCLLRDPQTLRSYDMKTGQVIIVLRRAPTPPSTPSLSVPRKNSPTVPIKTGCRLYTKKKHSNTPQQIHPLISNPDYSADIIESLPPLRALATSTLWGYMLQRPLGLHYTLLYVLYLMIKNCIASPTTVVTDNIKARMEEFFKVKNVYQVHRSIPPGPDKNQMFLGLLGLNLVGTSGSGLDENQIILGLLGLNLVGNSGGGPGENELSLGLLGSLPEVNSDPLPNPWANNRANWDNIYQGTAAKLRLIISSDPTLQKHCVEQFQSIEVAGESLKHSNTSQLPFPLRFRWLATELDAYFAPILEKLPLQNDVDYDLSGSFSDASIVDVPHEEVFEETFASRLAQMEQMGFMDKRENIKALFRSDGDVNKAVERLLEKQNPEG